MRKQAMNSATARKHSVLTVRLGTCYDMKLSKTVLPHFVPVV